MPTIKKILFPVDFSERCLGAARYVESMAGWFEAEIMLLHVVDTASYAPVPVEELRAARRVQLNAFLAEELKQFNVRRVCEVGDPAAKIAAMALEWKPDLLMMPTHGLGRYRRLLLGSVTAKVLHDVNCPVWTAVHSETAPPLDKITCMKVLCAVDLGMRSPEVLKWAAFLATGHEAELGIVHATPIVEAPSGPALDREFTEPLAQQARILLDGLQSEAGTKAPVFVDGGEPAKVVSCAAKEFKADVLVIGRHGGEGHLRHNSYAILRDSPCPVISI